MTFPLYASVIIEGGMPKPLDYGIPKDLINQIKEGSRVEVTLRGNPRPGIVHALKKQGLPGALPIAKLLPQELSPDLIALAEWMARYYCTTLSAILRTMVPSSVRVDAKKQLAVEIIKTRETLRSACAALQNSSPAQARLLEVILQGKQSMLLTEVLEKAQSSRSSLDALEKKGWIALREVIIDRSPLADQEYFPTKPKTLNSEQQAALDAILNTLGTFQTHLLYGITGSGKTEVYLQAIEKALDHGVIMLVPEISLTPQTVERFRSRFEGHIAVLHHRLSDGERRDEWERIRKGKAKIVIGPRSAIFSPMPSIGLIIVDEEHESSYKQSDGAPHYHARDVAIMRGKFTNSTVVLGTATPSLESMYNCHQKKYHLSTLSSRADSATLPKVKLIDMANEKSHLSEELLSEIKNRFEVGEQTLLFLNRRGYNSMLFCSDCKQAIRCPHCDLSLTFHRSQNRLSCHLCAYSIPPPTHCPECNAKDPLAFRGCGTEQIERSLHAIFPEIRTLRVDADTTRHKGSHERLLRSFCSGKADVLIGTQMIAKGLHFPQVTLVGVLNSDLSLNLPDYRASESVFQLLTQVAGRSGRGALSGKVFIQTRMPKNETILLAASQDYDAFYTKEIEVRKLFNYPPFTHLIKLTFSGTDARKTEQYAQNLHAKLSGRIKDTLPVTPCGYAKIKDRYRFQFIIRGKSVYTLNRAITEALTPPPKGIRLQINVDPTSTYF